jgi:DNA-binding CsgD family transcriptional regulator
MSHTTNDSFELLNSIPSFFNHKIERIRKEVQFRSSNYLKFDSLTRREEEVLSLVVKDFTNQEIADLLFISRFTVEQHRKNVNRKLGLNSAIQLYRFALAFDMV